MSADTPEPGAPEAPTYAFNGADGEGLLVAGYDESNARESLAHQLQKQVAPTPDPDSESEEDMGTGGVVRRSNQFRSRLTPTMLESIALSGMELAKAIERRARDLYRNKFPLLQPRYESICRACEIGYDEDVDECPQCGAETDDPDESQRAEARAFFQRVNKEGQSLSELYQELGKDAGRLGGWVHIVRHNYGVLAGETMREPVELVRADPKRLKPVVDENGRIGGYWWTCPIHREDAKAREPGTCEECGADLQEVFFAETEGVENNDIQKYYFEHEVIDHAAFNERLAGHDWVSPVINLWKRQAILEWMNSYAAAFFDDQNTNRYPGKMLILHTTNKNAVEKQLKEAADERDEDPYANGVLYNEIPRGDNGGSGDAQVIDLMSQEIVGQSPEMKKDFKSDIRSVYGQVDAQDSELEDAGGLNNEGLQLTVRDDAIASWHQSLKDGPLTKLMRVMGWTDWEIAFVPPEGPERDSDPAQEVQAAATAEQAGIPYAVEDGRFRLVDSDGEREPEGAPDAAPEGEPTGDDAGGGFGQSKEVSLDVGLEEEAAARAAKVLNQHEAADGARHLETVHDELFGPFEPRDGMETQMQTETLEQQRAPVFHRDDDVPQFADELVGDAIEGGAITESEELTRQQNQTVERVTRDNLTQDAGWSIADVTSDLERELDVDDEKARTLAVNAVQDAVNAAIMLGYTIGGDLDERRFYLAGPHHPNICKACENVLFETNPQYVGAEPVALDELQDMIEREVNEHFEGDMEPMGGKAHINCKHRVSEYREARS